jgi:hypothetical protein
MLTQLAARLDLQIGGNLFKDHLIAVHVSH